MKKILFFDFDDTLSYNNQPISYELIYELKRISKVHEVVVATGQTSHFMFGVFRQIGGMDDISIIGENGATINVGSKIPPKTHLCLSIDEDVRHLFNEMRQDLCNTYGEENLWFSPNELVLTVTPKDEEKLESIYNFFLTHKTHDMLVHRHRRSVEILPNYINKATGIKEFFKIQGLDREDYEIHAFGDSANDIQMFDLADHAYVIGDKLNYFNEHIPIHNENELIFFLATNF